jgi:hypothetical protein
MRARLLVLALIISLLAAFAPAADAASTRRLCARSAVLRDSPEGFVIARLQRPQRLRYLRRSANRRWALVRTRTGLVGWIRYRSLCHA